MLPWMAKFSLSLEILTAKGTNLDGLVTSTLQRILLFSAMSP